MWVCVCISAVCRVAVLAARTPIPHRLPIDSDRPIWTTRCNSFVNICWFSLRWTPVDYILLAANQLVPIHHFKANKITSVHREVTQMGFTHLVMSIQPSLPERYPGLITWSVKTGTVLSEATGDARGKNWVCSIFAWCFHRSFSRSSKHSSART